MCPKNNKIAVNRIVLKLGLLICISVMTSTFSFAKEDTTEPKQPELQVSMGDYLVVAEAAPWAWAVSETNFTPEGAAKPGEPAYVRPPRCQPVHVTIPNIIRHPLTGDLVLIYSTYYDGHQEHSMAGVSVSRDGGWTWTPPKLVKYLLMVGPYKRGWISMSFLTGYQPDNPHQVRVCIQRSDDGLNWTEDETEGVITFPENMKPRPLFGPDGGGWVYDNARSLRGRYKSPATVYMAKRIIEHDNALYACGYGQFSEDVNDHLNFLVRSEDGGKTWHFYATTVRGNESDFCWLPNGDMLVESRSNYYEEPRPLLQVRSTDGGLTWSKEIPAPGVELVTEADRTWYKPDGEMFSRCSGANIDPVLLPMGNGVLALAYGRPGWNLRFSLDGRGESWSDKTVIVPKYAVTDGKPWAFPLGAEPSHAMGGMVPLSDRTVLVTSNIYGYSPSGDPKKGKDVVFVVPVSIRKKDDNRNSAPKIRGPKKSYCAPGRKVTVKFDLKDPDGDWVRLVCPETSDVEIKSNTISFKAPWEFKGSKKIKVVAEDAWGLRSKEHKLTIKSDEKKN